MRLHAFCSFAEGAERSLQRCLKTNILERSARAGQRATLVHVVAVKLTRCKNDAVS